MIKPINFEYLSAHEQQLAQALQKYLKSAEAHRLKDSVSVLLDTIRWTAEHRYNEDHYGPGDSAGLEKTT